MRMTIYMHYNRVLPAVGLYVVSRVSVRPPFVRDVQVGYRDHIGWNTSKNKSARADPNMGDLVQREHPQN